MDKLRKQEKHYNVVIVATIKTKPMIVNGVSKDDVIGKVFSLLENHNLYNIKLERTIVSKYEGEKVNE